MRPLLFQRHSNASHQATSPDRHEHGPHIGQRFQYFQPNCALARDHGGIVEWMIELQLALLLFLFEALLPLADGHEYDVGAVAADCLQFAHLGIVAYHHDAGDTDRARGIGKGLSVVAGGQRDDSTIALLRGELENRIHGAAYLEGSCALETLRLEPDSWSGNGLTREDRGGQDVRSDAS